MTINYSKKLPNKRIEDLLLEAMKEAIKRAGSEVALAEIWGVSQPAVSQALTVTRRIPLHHVPITHQVLKMSRKQQRPDIY